MPSNEETDELNTAIGKLQDLHTQGEEIRELIELGPSGHARDGEFRTAADTVGRKWGVEIPTEKARKAVEFSKQFTSKQRRKLVEMCTQKGFCPEAGTIFRLLPFGARERNRLLKQIIENRWTKTDVDAALEKLKPADQLVDTNRRGRKPKAAKSRQSLTGEAIIDARKWAHVLDTLEHSKQKAPFKLSAGERKELRSLIKLLKKIGQWRV